MTSDVIRRPDQQASQGPDFPWIKSYPANIDWHAKFPVRPLHSLLHDAAANFPKHICTDFLGKQTSYEDVHQAVTRVAAGLQGLGVKEGVKVGLFLPNSPTFIIYYYAILQVGGVVVNYNPLYTVEELAYQVEDSETEIMVTLDLKALFEKVEALLEQGTLNRAVIASFPGLLPPTKAAVFKLFRSREIARPLSSPQTAKITLDADFTGDRPPDPVAIDPEQDIAVLQYTGGTTGQPKGAMLTHANVMTNTRQVAAWAPNLVDGGERILGVLPFFHVFAMTVVMNLGIAKAAKIIIMPRFVLNDALRLIQSGRPTILPGVPTLFNAILNHPKIQNYDLSTLVFCISGGAPLPVEVKEKFEALTGCAIVEGYGLSETSPVVTCNVVDGLNKAGSIGLPFPQTIISLRDLEDPTKTVPDGEPGEICVKGPQVMVGYWKRTEETQDVFVDGFLRTGDVARMDEDGMFFIEDRIKDLIITSGFNVYPRQIEEALYTIDAIEEATVIGVPHEHKGEVPKAFLKLKAGAQVTSDEVMAQLSVKLSKLELPAEIEFRDALPKTMIGKLSKKELKAEEMARRQDKG
ncbi:MAG: long-chain fatty acid--CoA ligase [Pseudomonadota bacterium]